MPTDDDSDPNVGDSGFLDDEAYARIDAAVQRSIDNGEPPDLTHRRDDGPDPLGIDWAWAGAKLEVGSLGEPTPPTKPSTATARPTRARNRSKYLLPAALAASIAFAIVAWAILRPRDEGPETVGLDVKPSKIQLFGTEQPQPTFERSPLSGFVAAVTVSRTGDVQVWPAEGDRPGVPVAIRKSDPARIGPLAGDIEYVVVAVTEQPATATLMQQFRGTAISAEQRPELSARIAEVLRSQNYKNIAIGRADYTPGR